MIRAGTASRRHSRSSLDSTRQFAPAGSTHLRLSAITTAPRCLFNGNHAGYVGEPNFSLFTGATSIGRSRGRHTAHVGGRLRRRLPQRRRIARPAATAHPRSWSCSRRVSVPQTERRLQWRKTCDGNEFANAYIVGLSRSGWCRAARRRPARHRPDGISRAQARRPHQRRRRATIACVQLVVACT